MNFPLSRLFFLSIAVIFALIIVLLWVLNASEIEEDMFNERHAFKDTLQGQQLNHHRLGVESGAAKMSKIQWKSVNLLQETFSQDVEHKAKNVVVEQHRSKIENYDVFYRKAAPPHNVEVSNQEILLLHGMRFKSQTWLELSTIQLLAAMGHHVTAIDFPGYGESSKEHVPEPERGKFLNQLITSLKLKRPIIVSPSLSGSFTVPLLDSNPEQFGGYVPVAPIKTGMLTPEQYKKMEVPTLIIYGEKDKELGEESCRNLGNIPTSQIRMLPNAGHPAYLDQPEMFHQLLYNFIKLVDSTSK